MERIDRFKKITEVETILEYRKWVDKIPSLKFDKEWEIQIIPPFGGAICRFIVFNDHKSVSVYLDCYDILGVFRKPYWEAYPINDDIFRCEMNSPDTLISMIREELKQL